MSIIQRFVRLRPLLLSGIVSVGLLGCGAQTVNPNELEGEDLADYREQDHASKSEALTLTTRKVLPFGEGIAVGKQVEFKVNTNSIFGFWNLADKANTTWKRYSATDQEFTGPGISWRLRNTSLKIPGTSFTVHLCRLDFDIDRTSNGRTLKTSVHSPTIRLRDIPELAGILAPLPTATKDLKITGFECTNHVRDDESNNLQNNNAMGLTLPLVGNDMASMWPKREDRTRILLRQDDKLQEFEIDTQE